jgi:hypothetical protein
MWDEIDKLVEEFNKTDEMNLRKENTDILFPTDDDFYKYFIEESEHGESSLCIFYNNFCGLFINIIEDNNVRVEFFSPNVDIYTDRLLAYNYAIYIVKNERDNINSLKLEVSYNKRTKILSIINERHYKASFLNNNKVWERL